MRLNFIPFGCILFSGTLMAAPLFNGTQSSSPSQQFRPSDYTPGRVPSGSRGTCPSANGQVSIPSSVSAALQQTIAFYRSCSHTRGFESSGKHIAINDYSSGSNPPRLFIFDASGSRCVMSTPIAYGGGGRRMAPPAPCSGDGQKLTPPGIHVTASHNGKRYSGANAIGMVGLSGQGSVGRGVIMHPKNSAGAPSTWGCTGIKPSDFTKARNILGEGSLVYNYFGSARVPGHCSDSSGIQKPPQGNSCRPDPGGASPQALIRSHKGSGGFGYGSQSPSGPRRRTGPSSGTR